MSGLFDIDAAAIPDDQIPAAIAALAALQTSLATRLMTRAPAPGGAAGAAEEWIDVTSAAKLIGYKKRWFYRQRNLPFIKRVSSRKLLINRTLLDRWLKSRRS